MYKNNWFLGADFSVGDKSSMFKKIVKFEFKLLLAVLALAVAVYFGSQALIARSAAFVADQYTQDLK